MSEEFVWKEICVCFYPPTLLLVFWIFHDKIFSVRLFAIYLEYASFGIIIFFQRWKRFIVVEQGGNCGCMKML